MTHNELPASGVIESFDAVDGLGSIRLADGTVLRFGFDSLRGIEPDFDAEVVVHEIRDMPVLGACAFDVRDARLSRLSPQEQRAELVSRLSTSPEPADHIGQFAVLFDGEPPMTEDDWHGVGEHISTDDYRFEIEVVPDGLSIMVTVDGHMMPAEIRLRPVATVGPEPPPHSAFVSVIANPLAFADHVFGQLPDPWGNGLWARAATKLALALLESGGVAVQIPAAFSVKDAEQFETQAGDPSDPEQRGWEAWVDGGFDDDDNFVMYGLANHGLPDIAVKASPKRSRLEHIEIARHVCRLMVFENRVLDEGERVAPDGGDEPWYAHPTPHELVLSDAASPRPAAAEHGVPARMTEEAKYFCQQADVPPEAIIACGYFTSPLKSLADGIQARAWFVGLTDRALVTVETRPPATSKPLLENKGVQVFDRRDILRVDGDHVSISIDIAGDRGFRLAAKMRNRWFPDQERLVELLLANWSDGLTIAELQYLRRIALLKHYGFIVIVVLVSVALLMYLTPTPS